MNQSPSTPTGACADQAPASETLKIPHEPLLVDPAADAQKLQGAINMRLQSARAILASLVANDEAEDLSYGILTDVLDGARHLVEEAAVLSTRQWEVFQGRAQS